MVFSYVPDKPMWIGHLDRITAELNALPQPWIDRATVERVLQVGRRRAQQLLAPCVSFQTGSSGLAHRDQLLAHLRQLATGESAHYERQRRRRLARTLEELHAA